MRYHITLSSSNRKTGPIPVVTSSSETCPDVCPLKNGGGCYAELGPLALFWRKVTNGAAGGTLSTVLKVIKGLQPGTLWRWGQAGDLPGRGNRLDRRGVLAIAEANSGKRAIVFTHKPPTKTNLSIIRAARDEGLNINLSANNMEHASELAKTGLPVVTVLPSEYGRQTGAAHKWAETLSEFRARTRLLPKTTIGGHRVAICPATYTDVTCQQCGVCSRSDRNGVIVGFPAHGGRKNLIDRTLRPVVRKESNGNARAARPSYHGNPQVAF